MSFQGRDVNAASATIRTKINDAFAASLSVCVNAARSRSFGSPAVFGCGPCKTGGFASPSLNGFALDNSEFPARCDSAHDAKSRVLTDHRIISASPAEASDHPDRTSNTFCPIILRINRRRVASRMSTQLSLGVARKSNPGMEHIQLRRIPKCL